MLTIKDSDPEYIIYKDRLVILGHRDPEKARVVNEAPTILRASVRLIITLAISIDLELSTRDVIQEFVKSREFLKRVIFIRPPKNQRTMEMLGAPPNGLLLVGTFKVSHTVAQGCLRKSRG